jgi:hypothetical protein
MTFNPAAITDILSLCETRISDFYKDHSRPPGFRIKKPQGNGPAEVIAKGLLDESISNHRRLYRDKLIMDLTEDMKVLEALLRQTFPVLDNDYLSFDFESFPGKAGSAGTKFRVSIRDSERANSAVLLPTLIKRLTRLHERIGNLTPGEDVFLVNDVCVPASTPQDALRIFLAIYRPDLFTKGPQPYLSFTVSKIYPTSIEAALS